MRQLALTALFVLAACDCSKVGTDTSATCQPPPNTTCMPTATFCDGNKLLSCTRSGNDAVLLEDCSFFGTMSNPGICMENCTGGSEHGAACCARKLPRAAWKMDLPERVEGEWLGEPPGAWANYQLPPTFDCPTANPNAWNRYFSARIDQHTPSCPAGGWSIQISIDRAHISPGQSVTLHPDDPNFAALEIDYFDLSGGLQDCSHSWEGTVTFVSDVPNWKVTTDVICRAELPSRPNTVQLRGEFSGNN